MPIYLQKCDNCGSEFEDYRPISRFAYNPPCRECCGKTSRQVARSCASTNHEYQQPVLSESMGVLPEQVAERRARFPDIPHTDDGRVIVKSQAELRRITKQLGFVDRSSYS